MFERVSGRRCQCSRAPAAGNRGSHAKFEAAILEEFLAGASRRVARFGLVVALEVFSLQSAWSNSAREASRLIPSVRWQPRIHLDRARGGRHTEFESP